MESLGIVHVYKQIQMYINYTYIYTHRDALCTQKERGLQHTRESRKTKLR